MQFLTLLNKFPSRYIGKGHVDSIINAFWPFTFQMCKSTLTLKTFLQVKILEVSVKNWQLENVKQMS